MRGTEREIQTLEQGKVAMADEVLERICCICEWCVVGMVEKGMS